MMANPRRAMINDQVAQGIEDQSVTHVMRIASVSFDKLEYDFTMLQGQAPLDQGRMLWIGLEPLHFFIGKAQARLDECPHRYVDWFHDSLLFGKQ